MAQSDENEPRLDADNWEAAALRRVARHVESLPETPSESEDFGWEAAVLEKLRKRLATAAD
jgi:hypothetical protein